MTPAAAKKSPALIKKDGVLPSIFFFETLPAMRPSL